MPKYLVRALQPQGFWRGGIHFPADGVKIDTEKLTKQQVDLIMGEKRMLLITEVPEEIYTEPVDSEYEMTKKKLEAMTLEELRALAATENLEGYQKAKKADLIEMLMHSGGD